MPKISPGMMQTWKRPSGFWTAIKEYLNENYTNPGLGLYTIASHFNMSEAYLSSLFKEQTGENISFYLENIRMKHALDMLKTGKYPINVIAVNSGYHNRSTFYKAFKRMYNICPSDITKGKIYFQIKDATNYS